MITGSMFGTRTLREWDTGMPRVLGLDAQPAR